MPSGIGYGASQGLESVLARMFAEQQAKQQASEQAKAFSLQQQQMQQQQSQFDTGQASRATEFAYGKERDALQAQVSGRMRQEDLAIGEQDRADAENKFAITQAWNGTEIASRREQDKEEMLSRERIARMAYDQRAAAQSPSPQALPIPLKAEIAALRKYPDAQTAIVSPEMQRLLQQYPQFAYELTGALGELYEGGLRPESFIDQQMRTASEPGAPGAPGEPGAPGAPAQFSYDPATGGLRPRVR